MRKEVSSLGHELERIQEERRIAIEHSKQLKSYHQQAEDTIQHHEKTITDLKESFSTAKKEYENSFNIQKEAIINLQQQVDKLNNESSLHKTQSCNVETALKKALQEKYELQEKVDDLVTAQSVHKETILNLQQDLLAVQLKKEADVEFKQRITDYQQKFATNEAETSTQIQQLRELLEKITGERDVLTTDLESLRCAQLEDKRAHRSSVEQLQSQIVSLKDDLQTRNLALQNITIELETARELIEKYKSEHSTVQTKSENLNCAMTKLRQDLNFQASTSKEVLDKMRLNLCETKDEVDKLCVENQRLNELIVRYEESNQRLEEELSSCNSITQNDLKKAHTDLEQMQSELLEKNDQMCSIQSKLKKQESLYEQLQQRLVVLRDDNFQLTSSERKTLETLNEMKNVIKLQEDELAGIRNENERLKIKINHVTEELSEAKASRETLKTIFEKDLKIMTEQHREASSLLGNVQEAKKSIEDKLDSQTQLLHLTEEQCDALKKQIQEERITSAKRVADTERKIGEEFQQRIEELTNRVIKFQDERSELQVQKVELEKKTENLQRELDYQLKEIAQKEREFKTVRMNLQAKLESSQEDAETLCEESEAKDEEIYALKQTLEEKEMQLQASLNEQQTLQAQFLSMEQNYLQRDEQCDSLKEAMIKLQQESNRVQTSVAFEKASMKSKENDSCGVNIELKELRASLERFQNIHMKSEEQWKNTRANLEEEVQTCKKEYDVLKIELSSKHSEIKDLTMQISDLRQLLNNTLHTNDEQKSQLDASLANNAELKEQFCTLRDRINFFENQDTRRKNLLDQLETKKVELEKAHLLNDELNKNLCEIQTIHHETKLKVERLESDQSKLLKELESARHDRQVTMRQALTAQDELERLKMESLNTSHYSLPNTSDHLESLFDKNIHEKLPQQKNFDKSPSNVQLNSTDTYQQKLDHKEQILRNAQEELASVTSCYHEVCNKLEKAENEHAAVTTSFIQKMAACTASHKLMHEIYITDLHEKEEKLFEVSTRLTAATHKINMLSLENEQFDASIAVYNNDMLQIREQYNAAMETLSVLRNQIAQAKAELQEKETTITFLNEQVDHEKDNASSMARDNKDLITKTEDLINQLETVQQTAKDAERALLALREENKASDQLIAQQQKFHQNTIEQKISEHASELSTLISEKESLEKLVNQHEKEIHNSHNRINDLKQELENSCSMISQLKTQLNESIQEVERIRECKVVEIGHHQHLLQESEQRLSEVTSKMTAETDQRKRAETELEDIRQMFIQTDGDLSKTNEKLQNLQETLQEKGAECENITVRMMEKINERSERIRELEQHVQRSENQLHEVKLKEKSLKEEVQDLQQVILECNNNIATTNSHASTLQERLSEAERNIKNLQLQLEESERQKNEFEGKWNALRNEHDCEIVVFKEKLEEGEKNYYRILAQLEEKQATISHINDELAEKRNKIECMRAELIQTQQTLCDKESNLQHVITNQEQRINQLESALDSKQQQIEGIFINAKDTNNQFVALQSSFEDKCREVDKLTESRSQLQEKINDCQAAISHLNDELSYKTNALKIFEEQQETEKAEAAKLTAMLSEKQSKLLQTQDEITHLKISVNTLENSNTELEKQLYQMSEKQSSSLDQIKHLQDELKSRENDKARNIQQIRELEQHVEEYNKNSNVGRERENEMKIIFETKSTEMKKKIAILESNATTLKQQKDILTEENRSVLEQLQSEKAHTQHTNTKLSEALKKVTDLQKRLNASEKVVSQLSNEHETACQRIRKELGDIAAQQHGTVERRLQEVQQAKEDLQKLLEQSTQENESLKTSRSILEEQLSAITRDFQLSEKRCLMLEKQLLTVKEELDKTAKDSAISGESSFVSPDQKEISSLSERIKELQHSLAEQKARRHRAEDQSEMLERKLQDALHQKDKMESLVIQIKQTNRRLELALKSPDKSASRCAAIDSVTRTSCKNLFSQNLIDGNQSWSTEENISQDRPKPSQDEIKGSLRTSSCDATIANSNNNLQQGSTSAFHRLQPAASFPQSEQKPSIIQATPRTKPLKEDSQLCDTSSTDLEDAELNSKRPKVKLSDDLKTTTNTTIQNSLQLDHSHHYNEGSSDDSEHQINLSPSHKRKQRTLRNHTFARNNRDRPAVRLPLKEANSLYPPTNSTSKSTVKYKDRSLLRATATNRQTTQRKQTRLETTQNSRAGEEVPPECNTQ